MKKLFRLLILTILLTSSCARQVDCEASVQPKVEISERSVDIEPGARPSYFLTINIFMSSLDILQLNRSSQTELA